MICQVKRDPDTNEILEVLDPFSRPSKVFNQYYEYWSERIDDPMIAKEEAVKAYLMSNNAEGTVKFMAEPLSQRLLPIEESTANEFLDLNDKELLLGLKYYPYESIKDLLGHPYLVDDLNNQINQQNNILENQQLLINELNTIYENEGKDVITLIDRNGYYGATVLNTYQYTESGWVRINQTYVDSDMSYDSNLITNQVIEFGGNTNKLIDLNKYWDNLAKLTQELNNVPTYDEQFRLTHDFLKKMFIDLGFNIEDVSNLADLYISAFVNKTNEPSLFYYAIAAISPNEDVQKFIYNNLPLYEGNQYIDGFSSLLNTLQNHYDLSETYDPSRINYVKQDDIKEGRMTNINPEIFDVNEEGNIAFKDAWGDVSTSYFNPNLLDIDLTLLEDVIDIFHYIAGFIRAYENLNDEGIKITWQQKAYDNAYIKLRNTLIDNKIFDNDSLIDSFIDLLTSPNPVNKQIAMYQLLGVIQSEHLEYILNNIDYTSDNRNIYSSSFEGSIRYLYRLNEYLKKLDNQSVYKLQPQAAPEESRIKIDKAKANVRAILGDAVGVSTDIETVMDNMKVSGVPFGLFLNNLIYLNAKAAEEGTEYHESFHAVFRLFLTDNEIDLYLREAKKEMNLSEEQLMYKMQQLRDSVSNYESLSDRELEALVYEEYLADKYQEFVKTNKPSTTNLSIISLFNRLMNAFLKLIGVRSNMEALFHDINNQRFKNKNFTPNRFVRQMKQIPVFQLIILDNNGADNNNVPIIKYAKEHETDKIISDIAALIYQEIRSLENQPTDVNDTPSDHFTIFEKMMTQRSEFYNPKNNKDVLGEYTGKEKIDKIEQLKKLSEVFSLDYEKNAHNINVIWEGVKEKFNLFHFNPFGDLNDDSDIQNDPADNREMRDISNVEIGGYDIVNSQLREFMSLITYDAIDEYTGKTITKSVDGSVVYNGLVKALASTELDDFMEVFKNYVKYGNEMSKAVFDVLSEKTGYDIPSKVYDPDHQLINLFRNTFDKEVLTYLQLLFDSEQKAFVIMNANREDVDKMQIDQWAQTWDNLEIDKTLSDKDKRKQHQSYIDLMKSRLFDDSVKILKTSQGANDFQEKYEKLLNDIIYGFTVRDGSGNIVDVPGFEQLTGMTLSKGFISFSILDHLVTTNWQQFDAKISLTDRKFYDSFRNITSTDKKTGEVDRIQGLTPENYNSITSLMFKSEKQVEDLQEYYKFKEQEERKLGRSSQKYLIDSDKFRNIYIPFPNKEIKTKDSTEVTTIEVLGFIKKIAINNAIFDESVVETSFQDASQKQRYSHVMKSFQTVTTRRLRNKAFREQLVKEYNELFKTNYLLDNKMTDDIFDSDFKFVHIGDVRQTFVKDRTATGQIIEDASNTSEVVDQEGVTSRTIDFKSLNILMLSLFASRKVKEVVLDKDLNVKGKRQFAYFNPKVFETKSTDEAILLPVDDIKTGGKFFDENGITGTALNVLYDAFNTELALIDKVERELNEGIESFRSFAKNQLNAEERYNTQMELAKLRFKNYDDSNLSIEDSIALNEQRLKDTARIAELEQLLTPTYTGPTLYEDFHIQTDGEGNLALDNNGEIKGVGRGFDLWNFKNITKHSKDLDDYIKARKKLANLNLIELSKPLEAKELTARKNAEAIVNNFNKNRSSLEAKIKEAIKKHYQEDFNNYKQRLKKYNIIHINKDGSLLNKLVPNVEKLEQYKNLEDFLGNFYMSSTINNMAYNTLIDKDPRIRKGAVDAVKRNAGSLAFGPNLGTGKFKVAFRQEQEKEYEIVTGDTKKINRDDGQAHMTVDRFIFALTRLGKVSDALKPILNKIRFGEVLTWEEKNMLDNAGATFNSVKGVYFDGENYQKLSYAILQRTWTSWLPEENKAEAEAIKNSIKQLEATAIFKNGDTNTRLLVKQLWDKYETLWEPEENFKKLHNLRVNMQFNGIDEVLPPSASKLINPIVASEVNGHHDFSYNTVERKNEFWRLQVETPSGKTKIVFPSQLLQNIDSEQQMAEVARIRGEVYEMSEINKKYRQALTDKVRNSVEQAVAMLGEYKDGKFHRDVANFQKKIKETLLASGSDEILLDFFRELSPDGKSAKYNPNIPAIRAKFEQLFLAHFSKNVLQQVVPGRKVYLISDWGNDVIVDSNDTVITRLEINKDRNKFYEKDSDGKYKLKSEYKTRRLQWSKSGKIQGLSVNGKLIENNQLNVPLDDHIISLIKDAVDISDLQNIIMALIGDESSMLAEYTKAVQESKEKNGKPIKPKYITNIQTVISGLQNSIDTLGLKIAKQKGKKTGGTTTNDHGTTKGKDNKLLAKEFGVFPISKELQEEYNNQNKKEKDVSKYYNARTELNVKNSDVTIYFSQTGDNGGLLSTARFAYAHNKPFFIYGKTLTDSDLASLKKKNPNIIIFDDVEDTVENGVVKKGLRSMLSEVKHETVNIAGNREKSIKDDDVTQEDVDTYKEFESDVEFMLKNLFEPQQEIDESDPDVVVNIDKLKSLIKVVKQATLSEVIMPAWSKEIYNLKSTDLITYDDLEKFKEINSKLTEEDFRRHKINKAALDSIMQMFGTRIPVEDKRSMIAFKVVDFLPVEMGDVAILPYETIYFSGEDFDIDSKYVIRKDFYTTKDENGKTNFHVYGEYTTAELRDMYAPTDPTITDEEILDMHLWEEFVLHTASNNKNVIFNLDEAKAEFIKQNQGVDLFKVNDNHVNTLKEQRKSLKEEIKPLSDELDKVNETHDGYYKDYKKLKEELQEDKEIFNFDNIINQLPDGELRIKLSEANNIFSKFTKDDRKTLGELMKEEFDIQSSDEYREYSRSQGINNQAFDEQIRILNSLSNTSKVTDTSRQGLSHFVDRLKLEEGTDEWLDAQIVLGNIVSIKGEAAFLKKQNKQVDRLVKINEDINDILKHVVKIGFDKKGRSISLNDSDSHIKIKKEIYREAKTTLYTFKDSINYGDSIKATLDKINSKNAKYDEMASTSQRISELIELLKPLQKRKNDLTDSIKTSQKLISNLNREVLMIAMKMNKIPSSIEEFLDHPHYKTLNNSALNNEVVDLVTAMYLNEGMNKIRYAESSLRLFHGDGKKGSTDIGLSKIMLTLSGRDLEEYLYNTPEGIMQAKEANKLGAQLIGPVAITNVVKAILGRSNVKMRVKSIVLDGGEYNALNNNNSEDIEFEVKIDDEGKALINLKVNQEGVVRINKDNRVMSELSYLLAAMTDNAKHGDAFKLNLTLDTLGTYTYMISLGMGINRTMLFANQPALYEFNSMKAAKESAIKSNKDLKDTEKSNEINVIRKKYKAIAKELEDKILNASANLSNNMITYGGKSYNFDEFVQIQKEALATKNKNISLDSLAMIDSIKTFNELGIDYTNETKDQIVHRTNDITDLNTLKEFYTAVLTQVHAINAFDRLQKQSKNFIRINALSKLNQGFDSRFSDLQNMWDLIDMFKIDTESLLRGDREYTKLPKGSDMLYDIKDVLDKNEDMKQMLIHFLKINEISKEFVISQTDYFERIFRKITENLRTGITDRANTLKQIKEDFLSYLSLNAYKNMFIKRGGEVPFKPELIYSDLIDPKDPKGMNSRTIVQELNDLLADPKNSSLKNNLFIRTIAKEINRISKTDVNVLFPSNIHALSVRIDRITANSRKKVDVQMRRRIVNAFRELMSSDKYEIRHFADSLFHYLILKDGLQFKNGSFIKYLPAEMYQDYSDILEKVNYALRNNIWESDETNEGLNDIVGMTKKEIEDSFISLFARDPNNKDLFIRVTYKDLYRAHSNVENVSEGSMSPITTNGTNNFDSTDIQYLDIDMTNLDIYDTIRKNVLADNEDKLPLLTYIRDNNLEAHAKKDNFYLIFDKIIRDNGDEALRREANFNTEAQFKTQLDVESKFLNDETYKLVKHDTSKLMDSFLKGLPFKEVKDGDDNITGIQFPLFFTLQSGGDLNEDDDIFYDEDVAETPTKYDVYVLANYVPMKSRKSDDDESLTDDEQEKKNKYKYKGLKARYVKMSQINTSIYNYLYSPQEYKHLMLRLLEVQKKLNENLIPDGYNLTPAERKAYVELEAVDFIKEMADLNKDNYTYSFTQEEIAPTPGASFSKIISELKGKDTPSTFTAAEERILSKRLFGESRYKVNRDSSIANNMLTEKDQSFFKTNDILIKPVSNSSVLTKMKLNVNETALVKIDNTIYKVTYKGLTNSYDMIIELGLDRDNIADELKQFMSDLDNTANEWLGYNEIEGMYYPFKGKPTQIYQIEPYYESKVGTEIPNHLRPNYGISEVITAFGTKESNFKYQNIEVIDQVNDVFINKVMELYKTNSPHITVVFDDGSDYTQSTINYIVNGNINTTAPNETDSSRGLFVINTSRDMDSQIRNLKDFFVRNTIPLAYNKVMFVKSPDDKVNYNDTIKTAITNENHLVGLSKNLPNIIKNYGTIVDIVTELRRLNFTLTVGDVLKSGIIDIIPTKLMATEDGKQLYNKILQNADLIQNEINAYRRLSTILSENTIKNLRLRAKLKEVRFTLPHNMEHKPSSRDRLSHSEMRPELVEQGIVTTYDAIIAGVREQTTRSLRDLIGVIVGDIAQIITYNRPTVYVKIKSISDKSVGQLLMEDFERLGINTTLDTMTADQYNQSEYAKEWSKKEGWSIDYMFLNIDSLKDKHSIEFEYIPDIEKHYKDTGEQIYINSFGWIVTDRHGFEKKKALNSNAFMGYTDGKSKSDDTNIYLRDALDQGIPINDYIIPDESTQVFISVPGKNRMSETVESKILKKASEILEAGGTLIMNTLEQANKDWNAKGEGVILKKLFERFKDLQYTNDVSYTYAKYFLPNTEKYFIEDGQEDPNCI
jgi:hypothetical protein